jgi:hypothetical protein
LKPAKKPEISGAPIPPWARKNPHMFRPAKETAAPYKVNEPDEPRKAKKRD